jgi:hypothetical protein
MQHARLVVAPARPLDMPYSTSAAFPCACHPCDREAQAERHTHDHTCVVTSCMGRTHKPCLTGQTVQTARREIALGSKRTPP